MKDETQFGPDAMKTPVLGVPWAGDTEFGEPTLSDAETILLPRATVLPRSVEGVAEGRAEPPPVRQERETLARSLWRMARASLLGAAVCGVLGGLLVACTVVLIVRLASARPAAEAKSQRAILSALVRVESPAGHPVEGAIVRVGEQTFASDALGLVRLEQPLNDLTPGTARYRFELTCPGGMQATEPMRELLVPRSATRTQNRIERALSLVCASTRVALTLALRTEGGEARFWLGEQELGVTSGGRLEATVQVDKRTEQNLRAEPVIPKGERRKPTLHPSARTVVVLDDDLGLTHAVKVTWPKVKTKAPARQIPYRL